MAKRLSKRLQAIADMVPQGAYLADIGSDHAQLPIALVSSGKIDWAEAVENKMGPFLRMQDAINKAGLSSHISAVHADGIAVLNEGVDTLVLAGIGGLLSCDILESHPHHLDSIKTIILDPHRDLMAVRERVSLLGYHIVDETLVYEDKIYYSIIKFEKGAPKRAYSLAGLTLGPILLQKKGPLFKAFVQEQKKKVSSILDKPLSKEKRDRYLPLYRVLRDAEKACGEDDQSDSK